MPDCRYCGASFDDDDSLDAHLIEEHRDDLGPIDRRRIEGTGDGGGFPVETGPLVLLGVIGVAVALVAYVVFFAGGGSSTVSPDDVAQTPTGIGSVHYHGTMDVSIDGTVVDASDPAYVKWETYQAFHFDRVGDDRWHVHARGVTLEYAMSTFGIGVAENTVQFQGRTYDGTADGVSVTVAVNDEPVDPASYVLRQGDHVRVVVTTGP